MEREEELLGGVECLVRLRLLFFSNDREGETDENERADLSLFVRW